nr:uncharacterized protein LOC125969179 isoform X2 [Syngnathus scovelli]
MLNSSISPTHDCFKWDKVYPVASMTKYKPLFSSNVAKGNFTCIRLPGTGEKLGALPPLWCGSMANVTAPFLPIARSDIWFWCNSNKLYDRLPLNSSGICALVTLLLPVHLIPMSSYDLTSFAKSVVPVFWPRTKRNAEWRGAANPIYIDAIGVPRGVPDEYKLVNQIAAGFESALCWWCTINKNVVDRINYVHYNVQRLGNWTEAGFKAVHSQLAATSLMAFQNRMALDMLLSKEGGVYAMFAETFPLLQRDDLSIDAGSFSSDDPVGDSIVINLSGLFPDPGFAEYDSVSSRVRPPEHNKSYDAVWSFLTFYISGNPRKLLIVQTILLMSAHGILSLHSFRFS